MRFKSMIAVVRRTGHSSWYVEKGMNAMGKTPRQLGIQSDLKISGGGEHVPAVSLYARSRTTRSVSNMARGAKNSRVLLLQLFKLAIQNAPCCPIAILACYSGSSQDDHHVRVRALRSALTDVINRATLPCSWW